MALARSRREGIDISLFMDGALRIGAAANGKSARPAKRAGTANTQIRIKAAIFPKFPFRGKAAKKPRPRRGTSAPNVVKPGASRYNCDLAGPHDSMDGAKITVARRLPVNKVQGVFRQ